MEKLIFRAEYGEKRGFALKLKSIRVNTSAHGSFVMDQPDPLNETENGLKSSCAQSECAFERIDGEKTALFRVKAKMTSLEDPNGYLITMLPHDGLVMDLALETPCAGTDCSCLALYHHKAWWMRPHFAVGCEEIPEKTQLLIGRSGDDQNFFVLLAVCSDRTRTDLAGMEGGIRVSLSSNRSEGTILDELAFACGEGPDPYALIEEMYDLVRRNQTHFYRLRKEKELPEVFRSIGWCTWDSLGQNVNEADIFRKMDELREKQVPVRWVLIDDGWSYVDPVEKKLKSFGADPVKFPNGLKSVADRLKKEYHVDAVGVWQAMKGYWRGVADDFEDWEAAGAYLKRYGNGEISMKPEAAASFGFWDAWHSYLEREGIDFVKIDGQSSMQFLLDGTASYGEGLGAFYKGMEASVLMHFDGSLINCMGMAPESVFARSVTAVSRTSDDYLPTVSGSFYEHALQNAYDCAYQGALYFGDWDMFWTEHEDAKRSAILRMISGGPVYFSDGYGRTDPSIVRKMTDSQGHLLLCDDVGRPTLDCLAREPFRAKDGGAGLLKIYNRRGDTVLIACFSGEKPCKGRISLKEIPGLRVGRYLVYKAGTEEYTICADGENYSFEMDARDALVLELIPADQELSVIGMIGKYIPAAGTGPVRKTGPHSVIAVHCGGTLAFACGRKVKRILAGEEDRAFCEKNGLIFTELTDADKEVEIIME